MDEVVARLTALVEARRADGASPVPVPNRAARRAKVGRAASGLGLASMTALTAHAASALFTGTTSGTVSEGSITAADMAVTVGTTQDSNQHFDLAISDMYPGNVVYRTVDVTLAGTNQIPFSTLKVDTASTIPGDTSVLTQGDLLISIDICSGGTWSGTGNSPDRTYSCSGTTHAVLLWGGSASAVSILGPGNTTGTKDLNGGSFADLSPGATNHYLFKFSLKSAAGNADQGTTDTISFHFYGSQRSGVAK